jgi:hypothetical protein
MKPKVKAKSPSKRPMQILIDAVADTGHCVVFRGQGRRRVALVPVLDEEFLERIEEEIDLRLARKARKEKGGVTIEEMCKKYGVKVA